MGHHRKEFLRILGCGGFSVLAFPGMVAKGAVSDSPLIKPGRLKIGDTIGLISPASTLPDHSKYEEIADTIEKLGFRVKLGRHAKDRYGNLAGSDRERAADLNQMFADPDVHAIIPFRGGWGSNRILEHVDFDIIRQNPKPMIGFSDITSLLLAIHKETGLVTFHGPVGKSEWNDFTFSYFQKALMEDALFTMKNPEGRSFSPNLNILTPGTAQGRLLGGNLTVLTSMMGSDYLPDWDGAILFVEDIGEEVYRIDRMLTQLKLNGVLDQINGFIFGNCFDCKPDNSNSLSLEQVLKDHIQTREIPAFYGSMIGHIDNMFTIPIGIRAQINADNGSIKLLEVPTV